MNLSIKQIDNITVTEFFRNDPKLCVLGLGDQSLKDLLDGHLYSPPECSFTGFYNKENNELIGFIQATLFTETTINCHIFLRSDLHHSGVLRKMGRLYTLYIHKYYPLVKKIMCISPSTCEHVTKSVQGMGFKLEGCLTKAMIWRTKLVDMNIFGRELLVKEQECKPWV